MKRYRCGSTARYQNKDTRKALTKKFCTETCERSHNIHPHLKINRRDRVGSNSQDGNDHLSVIKSRNC